MFPPSPAATPGDTGNYGVSAASTRGQLLRPGIHGFVKRNDGGDHFVSCVRNHPPPPQNDRVAALEARSRGARSLQDPRLLTDTICG